MQFTGCGTALVTPFDAEGKLDLVTMANLVDRQIEAGIDFLVPCGTTGETPTLSAEEKRSIVALCVERAQGRVKIMAGAGGYDTHEVIETAREWIRMGAQGILSVTPYYNKPTQEGLYRHYQALASAVDAPIYVYNVPGRTGVNVELATLLRLLELPNIAGVKEASGNIGQIASICARVPSHFAVLAGDDALALPVIALGGHGLISVASNQIPSEMTRLVKAAREGNLTEARALQNRYIELMESNFYEANPVPVKASMALMGLLEANYRLPMCPPTEATQARLAAVLKKVGLV